MATVTESIGLNKQRVSYETKWQDKVATTHALYFECSGVCVVRSTDSSDYSCFVALLSTFRQLLDDKLNLG